MNRTLLASLRLAAAVNVTASARIDTPNAASQSA
jgi:hypothetical protein